MGLDGKQEHGNLAVKTDDLLNKMQSLLEQSKKTENIKEIEKIEQESNHLVAEGISQMKKSECDPELIRKLIDIHGKIIVL